MPESGLEVWPASGDRAPAWGRLGVDRTVGEVRLVVAGLMEVFDTIPARTLVDVADDLLESKLGLELHTLATEHAVDGRAWLDVAKYSAGGAFGRRGRFGECTHESSSTG